MSDRALSCPIYLLLCDFLLLLRSTKPDSVQQSQSHAGQSTVQQHGQATVTQQEPERNIFANRLIDKLFLDSGEDGKTTQASNTISSGPALSSAQVGSQSTAPPQARRITFLAPEPEEHSAGPSSDTTVKSSWIKHTLRKTKRGIRNLLDTSSSNSLRSPQKAKRVETNQTGTSNTDMPEYAILLFHSTRSAFLSSLLGLLLGVQIFATFSAAVTPK